MANTSWYLFNFRRGLLKALIKNGYSVLTLAPKDNFSIKLEEVGCHFIPFNMENQGLNPISDFRLRFKLESLYNHLNPSLAIHYTIKPVIFGSIAAAKLGIPFINNITGLGTAFIRSNWITLLVQFLYKISQKKASLILFQNKDDMRLFEEKKLVSKSVPKKLIPGTGVDVQEFSPRPYSMADENTFILIARLIWDKGVGEFIEAAKEIKKEFPKARFQILGFLDVKNRTAITRKQVDMWVKKGIVEFYEKTEDVRPYIEKSGCVVLPSYREGLPKTLLEAASMARPIIATDVTGCREVVINDKNGFLCDVRDARSLVEKIKFFLALTLKEKEKMGFEGRILVEDRFEQEKVVSSILGEIRKLLS